jgi:hypothetical protein
VVAVTTYSNTINTSSFFPRIPSDDQDYLAGALQEEMSHHLLEQSVTDQFPPLHDVFTIPYTCLQMRKPL